ncbi:MAG: hypothetical protein ABW185_28005 [Sedimenticola sp.]
MPAISPDYIVKDKVENTVSFTLMGRVSASPMDLLELLCEKDIPATEVISLYKTSESANSFSVTFRTSETVSMVEKLMVLCNDRFRFHVSALGRQVLSIRVHWLPDYVDNSLLTAVFSQYGTIIDITDTTVDYKQMTIGTGTRVVTIETDEVLKRHIPHLLHFECGQKVLLTMQGRPPLCLRCHEVGHIRRSCPNGAMNLTYSRAVFSQARPTLPPGVPASTENRPVNRPSAASDQASRPSGDSSAVDVSSAKLPTSTVATVQDVADDLATSESDDDRMDHSSQGMKRRASSSSDDFITPNRTAKKSSQIDSSVKVSNTFTALFTQSGAASGQDDDVLDTMELEGP